MHHVILAEKVLMLPVPHSDYMKNEYLPKNVPFFNI